MRRAVLVLCLSCASAPAQEPIQPSPRPEQTSPNPSPADTNSAQIAQSLEKASVQGAQLQARTIEQAAEIWRSSHPNACPSADDLVRDNQLNERATVDPWGSRYAVSCKGNGIEVRSPGPDRAPGTADDVIELTPPAPR